jgi:hypothetical protein
MSEMREAFERWFFESRKSKGASRRPTFERMEDGTYADNHTQRHFWTWQNAQAARIAELEAEVERLQRAITEFCQTYNWAAEVWKAEPSIKPLFDITRAIKAGKDTP